MKDTSKTYLFEEMPLPRAIAKLAVPTVISSLVMVLYNLADTWFVGMLILNRMFPLYGLAYAQFCAEFVLAIAAVFTINIMFRKMEQQNKIFN